MCLQISEKSFYKYTFVPFVKYKVISHNSDVLDVTGISGKMSSFVQEKRCLREGGL